MNFTRISDVRHVNRYRILNTIATHEGISRAQIAKTIGFNKVSTGEIVDSLIQEGFVSEGEKQRTGTGRPSTPLYLDRNRYTIIAVDIGIRSISFALVNLKGELLRFERIPAPVSPSAEELMALLIRHIQGQVQRVSQEREIIGIALSAGAQIDRATGTLLHHSQWDLHDVPLVYTVNKYTNLPVVLENNVIAMIQGEIWFSPELNDRRVFYVNWGEHMNGALYDRGRKVTPEMLFGHIKVRETGLCSCTGTGCLEAVASGAALERYSSRGNSVKALALEAQEDQTKQGILKEASRALADALITTSAIVRPETIIIGGGISMLPDIYLETIRERFTTNCPPIVNNGITIERSQLKERGGIIGTAVLALDEFVFHRSHINGIS